GAGLLMLARGWTRRPAFDFAGKSVLITGGSRGLGLVLARELADEGARLTLVARDADELARAAEDIRVRRPLVDLQVITADIRRAEDAPRAVLTAIQRFGQIDVLVNNAGVIQVGPIDHIGDG